MVNNERTTRANAPGHRAPHALREQAAPSSAALTARRRATAARTSSVSGQAPVRPEPRATTTCPPARRRAAATGELGCATSADEILIKGGTAGPRQERHSRTSARSSRPTPRPPRSAAPGAHTLVKPGERVYPEAGNGGYQSIHTDVFTVYDALANLFLPGTHVDLTQRSTQCLTDFSLDFDAKNAITSTAAPGTDMTVQSITVNGQPATFEFMQPTYPGDPNGQDDPDPLAHAAGSRSRSTATNPNPPACAPSGAAPRANGRAGRPSS